MGASESRRDALAASRAETSELVVYYLMGPQRKRCPGTSAYAVKKAAARASSTSTSISKRPKKTMSGGNSITTKGKQKKWRRSW